MQPVAAVSPAPTFSMTLCLMNQYYKLLAKERGRFSGMVAPTLRDPLYVYSDPDGSHVYVKSFIEGSGIKTFVSVAVQKDGTYVVITNGVRDMARVAKTISDAGNSGRLLKDFGHSESSATDLEGQPSLAGGLRETLSPFRLVVRKALARWQAVL